MKNKKPDAEILADSNHGFSDAVLAANEEACKLYLKHVDRSKEITDPRHKNLYNYTKRRLTEMNGGTEKADVRIALLIERIAILAVLLMKREEKYLENGQAPDGEYIRLTTEYRKTVETLVNMKYVLHKKDRIRTIEKLREIVSD